MKVKLIAWEAACNMAQEMHGEKYPHYALLMSSDDKTRPVLTFLKEGGLRVGMLQEDVIITELADVKIPYELWTYFKQYVIAKKELEDFKETFLDMVDEHRDIFDSVTEVIDRAENPGKSKDERLIDSIMKNCVQRPFPKRVRKKPPEA